MVSYLKMKEELNPRKNFIQSTFRIIQTKFKVIEATTALVQDMYIQRTYSWLDAPESNLKLVYQAPGAWLKLEEHVLEVTDSEQNSKVVGHVSERRISDPS